ncbi:hypothetical protein Scep_019260 [Stephania cephalantha]|uniref:Enoyl reductase (ER) domain-containing protein n=1 Tax=Stephania cephalantha TaxID=152367 RepID=A0AAP0IAC7_9MAGN
MGLFSRAFLSSRTPSRLSNHSKLILPSSLCAAKPHHRNLSDAPNYPVGGAPSFMRGTVFWGPPNSPLTIEDFHMPCPKAGELLIKTKACGVCHSDLHVIKGEIPFASPCVLGHEITGEVVDYGAHTDPGILKRYPIGAHVVGAFIMPCGSCSFCVKGQDDLCEAFFAYNRAKGLLYDGETRLFLRGSGKPVYMYSMGGLAEYCVVPAHALSVLPNSLPYVESAILGCAVFTAYGAMRHAAELRAGEAIAVIGVGGVGFSCDAIKNSLGAEMIIMRDRKDGSLHLATAIGGDQTMRNTYERIVQKVQEITGGMGVDVAVEALGNPRTFVQCTQCVRDGGKAVMIGLAASTAIGEVDINRLVRRQVKIIGSYGARARQDLPKIIKLAETGIFDLSAAVSRKCKLEEAGEAYDDLNKGSIIGRAVVEIM